MKTSFLKITVLATMLMGLFFVANAQIDMAGHVTISTISDPTFVADEDMALPADAGESEDTVTVGGQYRYCVVSWYETIQGQPYAGFYDESFYSWSYSDGSGSLTYWDGSTPLQNSAQAGYVTEDSIAIDFSGVTVGATTLTHNEWTNPKATGGTGCAAGTPTTLTIQVLNAPSVECVPDTVGGCDYHVANPTVNIPLTFDGAGPYEVYYKVIKNDFGGTPAVEQVYCDVIGATSADGSESLNLPVSWGGTGNDELGAAPTAFAEYGMYTIYIEDVVDRFSNKSLTYVQGSVTQGSYTGDEGTPDAADGYYIVDFPAPTAQPIQHIENTYHND